MKQKIVVGLVALVMGIVGVGLGLAVLHLWEDHKTLHALVQIEMQRQQAQQKNVAPTPEAK